MKTILSMCSVAVVLFASPASAETIHLFATLTGGEETPAVLTGAVGTAEVTVEPGNRLITVTLRLFNLPTATRAGHIHAGPLGVSGPVIIDFPIPAGRTGDLMLTFTVGEADLRARPQVGIETIDDAIQTIVGGGAYVNIHTTTNPGGEIRGQLVLR